MKRTKLWYLGYAACAALLLLIAFADFPAKSSRSSLYSLAISTLRAVSFANPFLLPTRVVPPSVPVRSSFVRMDRRTTVSGKYGFFTK